MRGQLVLLQVKHLHLLRRRLRDLLGIDQVRRKGVRCAAVVRIKLAPSIWCVQLGIRVRRVPISRAARRKNHRAAGNGALVHLAQVHGAEVDLQGALITEGLEADVAFDAPLARCWVRGELVEDLFVVHLCFFSIFAFLRSCVLLLLLVRLLFGDVWHSACFLACSWARFGPLVNFSKWGFFEVEAAACSGARFPLSATTAGRRLRARRRIGQRRRRARDY